MAEQINLSTGMLSMVKTGTRSMSRKAKYRLEILEKEAGIVAASHAESTFNILCPHADTKPHDTLSEHKKALAVKEESARYTVTTPQKKDDFVEELHKLKKKLADFVEEFSAELDRLKIKGRMPHE